MLVVFDTWSFICVLLLLFARITIVAFYCWCLILFPIVCCLFICLLAAYTFLIVLYYIGSLFVLFGLLIYFAVVFGLVDVVRLWALLFRLFALN